MVADVTTMEENRDSHDLKIWYYTNDITQVRGQRYRQGYVNQDSNPFDGFDSRLSTALGTAAAGNPKPPLIVSSNKTAHDERLCL